MLRKLLPVFLLASIAGCQTSPQRTIPEPPVTPQLISSSPLHIASTCEINTVIGIDYSIQGDGTVADLSLSDAPNCARDALKAWVSSYRYAPQSQPVATGFAWMHVTAERGS
jgi:hypothetical protein